MIKTFIVIIYFGLPVQVIPLEDFYSVSQCNIAASIIVDDIKRGDKAGVIQNVTALDCINLLGEMI
jgi:hypothetical protein